MFKKTFVFFLFFLSLNIFSKTLSIYISNSEGFPVDNAYVSVDNEIKKTNIQGFVEFFTDSSIVGILVEKNPYKSQEIITQVTDDTNLNIELKETYDFYLNLYEDNSFNYSFSSTNLEKTTIKDSIISVYKNGVLMDTLDYYGKDYGIDLKKGEYTLVIYTIFAPPYVIEDLKFDPKKSSYLNISIPLQTYSISGSIFNTDTLIGGANITLKDKNREFQTFSNIEGQYNLKVPAGIYEFSVEKIGYELIKKNIPISGNINNLSENMIEIPSILKGRILDNKGNSISNQNFLVKNNGNEIVVKTDSNGYYAVKLFSGLGFIKVDIPGYYPTGKVERIDSLSTKEVNDIILKERVSSLSGTLTNGILPIPNVYVKLYDENNNYFGMVKSDVKGYFSFEEVRSGINYFLSIEDPNYSFYKSETFINEDSQNRNFTIILNNQDFNFILELKSNKIIDYTELSVYINNMKFKSDKNGIINETIKSLKNIENLNIEIPKLGIKKTYKTSELGEKPYLITINF